MGLLSRLVADFSGANGTHKHSTRRRKRVDKALVAGRKCPMLHARYEIGQEIGKGATCVVLSGVDIVDQSRVAIKQINDPFFNRYVAKAYLKEVAIMRHLKHPNILSLRDVFIDVEKGRESPLYLVTDRRKTNLRRALKNHRGCFSPLHLKYFMFQILHGLKYMHACGIAHRDVKPSNVLVDQSGVIQVCDFGLSTSMLDPEVELSSAVVTRYYRAPELLLGSTTYSFDIDMWALGCTFFEILTGEVLFPGADDEDQLQVVVDSLGLPSLTAVPSSMSPKSASTLERVKFRFQQSDRMGSMMCALDPEARDLVSRLLQWDPANRLSAANALLHPYFHEVPLNYPSLFAGGIAPIAKPFLFALESVNHLSALELMQLGFGNEQKQQPKPANFLNMLYPGTIATNKETEELTSSSDCSSCITSDSPCSCTGESCRHRQRSIGAER
jgi:serine/threonine protein kinase